MKTYRMITKLLCSKLNIFSDKIDVITCFI